MALSEIARLVERVQSLILDRVYCCWISYCPQCGERIVVDLETGVGHIATAYVVVETGEVVMGPWVECQPCGVLAPAVPRGGSEKAH